jgi:hypothetical protein
MGFCIPSQNGGGEGRTDSLNALTTSKKKRVVIMFSASVSEVSARMDNFWVG